MKIAGNRSVHPEDKESAIVEALKHCKMNK